MKSLQKVYSDAERYTKEIIKYDDVERGLHELNSRDQQSYIHSLQSTHLALTLGLLNVLDMERLEILGIAAAMHDVGKSRTPLEVLLKPGKLTEDELKEMHAHVPHSIEILEGMYFDKRVLTLVGSIHENQRDAYPRAHGRITDPYLQIMSRIISIADHASGLAEKRPYKEPLEKKEICRLVKKDIIGNPKEIEQVTVVLGNGYLPFWNNIRF